MTLPTAVPTTNRVNDDDSDIFGPPRSSLTALSSGSISSSGYYHHRSRVPMISPKLRLREERKRILQLCAHKLERIKDSETNLRRSVCINNTYSRLTDELRREKQSRCHLTATVNSSKCNSNSKMSRDNIFSFRNTTEQNMELCNDYFYHITNNNLSAEQQQQYNNLNSSSSKPSKISNSTTETTSPITTELTKQTDIFTNSLSEQSNNNNNNSNKTNSSYLSTTTYSSSCLSSVFSSSSYMSNNKLSSITNNNISSNSSSNNSCNNNSSNASNNNCNIVDTDDLEILDRELSAINASMPLIDPEITQGAEQLEKAISSRKRSRSIEDENDRLVREALSQFYLPTQRLISEIEDCPFDIKRTKLSNNLNHIHNYHNSNNNNLMTTTDFDLELNFDYNQTQKDFEVIIDALRLGTNGSSSSATSSTTATTANDSCGQAAMMSESGVFHNLVVASLET